MLHWQMITVRPAKESEKDMQFIRNWIKDARKAPDDRYVAICDGIRVLAIFMVTWFHIWQQSWLYPVVNLFGTRISLDPLVRSGYMHVDIMILLSGFCLYLPCTRLRPDEPFSIRNFYWKRLVRIVPSYYLTILIMLIVALARGLYDRSYVTLPKDLGLHLIFAHMFRMETYYYTNLNAALWTLALEMQLYLVFPLLVALMRRRPFLTAGVITLLCTLFRVWLSRALFDIKPYFNQFPAYLDIFVLGMLTAFLYSRIRTLPHHPIARVLCSLGAVFSLAVIIRLAVLQSEMGNAGMIEQGQLLHRLPMALAGMALILLAGNAGWLIRHLLGNPVTRFFSGISMHIYIWNQVLAVWIRELRIVPSEYPNPNYQGDLVWQQRYTFVCFAAAIAAGILFTYGFERPVARLLLKGFPGKKAKDRAPGAETVPETARLAAVNAESVPETPGHDAANAEPMPETSEQTAENAEPVPDTAQYTAENEQEKDDGNA